MYIIEKEEVYKYKMLNLKTKKETFFKDLESLLDFLKLGQQTFYFLTLFENNEDEYYNNMYLDNCNITGYDRRIVKKYNSQTKDFDYSTELKEYMFYDSDNNVIDVRYYAKNIKRRAEVYREEQRWNNKPNYIFRRGPVPGTTNKYRGHYCRYLKTTREKRYSCALEHKPYVRAKRNYANIPDTYDDHFVTYRHDWKANSKSRKQWGRHLKGTKTISKYDYNDFFEYEDLLDSED